MDLRKDWQPNDRCVLAARSSGTGHRTAHLTQGLPGCLVVDHEAAVDTGAEALLPKDYQPYCLLPMARRKEKVAGHPVMQSELKHSHLGPNLEVAEEQTPSYSEEVLEAQEAFQVEASLDGKGSQVEEGTAGIRSVVGSTAVAERG